MVLFERVWFRATCVDCNKSYELYHIPEENEDAACGMQITCIYCDSKYCYIPYKNEYNELEVSKKETVDLDTIPAYKRMMFSPARGWYRIK